VPERKRKIILRRREVSESFWRRVEVGGGKRREGVHQRMGEADFAAVDCAVAGGLEDGEDVVVLRVENDALDGGLRASVS